MCVKELVRGLDFKETVVFFYLIAITQVYDLSIDAGCIEYCKENDHFNNEYFFLHCKKCRVCQWHPCQTLFNYNKLAFLLLQFFHQFHHQHPNLRLRVHFSFYFWGGGDIWFKYWWLSEHKIAAWTLSIFDIQQFYWNSFFVFLNCSTYDNLWIFNFSINATSVNQL